MNPPAAETAATPKGAATRAFILGVAAQVFAERGYAGTRLNDLIERSGLTKGAFYFHFRSKQALALAVVERKQEEFLERVERELATHATATEALRALGPAMLALHADDPSAWSVSRLSRELAREPEAEAAVRATMRAWVASVARLLRATAAERGRPLPADADALAAVLIAAFDGLKELSAVLDPDDTAAFTTRAGALQALVDDLLTGG